MNTRYRILLIDTKGSNPNHYICLALKAALSSANNVELVVKAEIHDAVAKAIKNKCNLFFAFDGEELDRTICSRAACVCGQAILWVTEDPYELSVNVGNADLFDLVFTNDSACVSAYGDKGRHLPLAGAKPFHYLPIKEEGESLRYDLFFAGTAWPNRVSLLRKVFDAQDGANRIKAKIALPTNEHLPPLDLPLAPSQLNWRTAPVDFARFANMSVSTLVLPRVFSSSGNRDFADTPPPRLYEAALAGTVQLVQSKLTEAEKYFEPGQDFLYFETADELINSVRTLRADIKWRNQIAMHAQNKALAQHCYEHRMSYVFAELQNLKLRSADIKAAHLNTFRKPTALFVVHNVVENGHFGGVEVYVKHISQLLGDDFDIYFYVPDRQSDSRAVKVLNVTGEVLHKYDFPNALSPWQLSCREREESFASALTELGVSLVHFHHLIGHPPSLVEIAKSLGVATAMTFHDYYALCHNFTLLSFKGAYCKPDEISMSQCDVCLWNMHHALPGSQASRRVYWDYILAEIGTLVFNTQGSYELASRVYPSVESHKNVEVLPVPMMPIAGRGIERGVDPIPLKVAILGNFTPQKGGNIMARVMPLMDHSNIEFHIFGHVDGEYAWLANNQAIPFVHVHGGYAPGMIPPEIFTCHVSLHLSIWPETYCLTLSESWDCGLVPIVTDIGALGERVIDGVNGLKIQPDSEGALVQALHRLSETPGLLMKLQKNLADAPISRTELHVTSLRRLYKSMVCQHIHVESKRESSSRLSLLRMGRYVPTYWAKTPSTNDERQYIPYRPDFSRKFIQLLKKGVIHLRADGVKSTMRASARYIARRF